LKVIEIDPADDIVINTAVDGKTDYIVTGDKHLLELRQFEWLHIVTVDEMLAILGR
jgi:predicted nucleic acid-binding protein